jgi:hypothetical protein
MHWWQEPLSSWIKVGLSAVVGLVTTIVLAWMHFSRSEGKHSRQRIATFVRENATEITALAFAALLGAPWAAILAGGIVVLLLDKLFHVSMDRDQRLATAGLVGAAAYVGSLIVIAAQLWKRSRR